MKWQLTPGLVQLPGNTKFKQINLSNNNGPEKKVLSVVASTKKIEIPIPLPAAKKIENHESNIELSIDKSDVNNYTDQIVTKSETTTPKNDSDLFQNYSVLTSSTDLIKDLSNTNFSMFTTNIPSTSPSTLVNNEYKKNENSDLHECLGSHRAMVECEVCGLFSHGECGGSFGGVRMCGVCLKEKRKCRGENNNTNGNGSSENDELNSDEADGCGAGYNNCFTKKTNNGDKVYLS